MNKLTVFLIFGYISLEVYGAAPSYDVFYDDCGIETADRQPCGRNHNTLGSTECQARGCCFDSNPQVVQVRCFLPKRMLNGQCNVPYEKKDDCGFYGITEAECLRRGCCYKPSPMLNDPECFNPASVYLSLAKEGFVYLYHEGKLGTVCSRSGDFQAENNVICRELGYHEGRQDPPSSYDMYDDMNEEFQENGDKPTITVDCNGDESSLTECRLGEWSSVADYDYPDDSSCSHQRDVYLRCYNEGERPRISEFYLTGGNRGLLYVRDSNGTTGTVCDDMFTDTEATVVCKSIGFASGTALYGLGGDVDVAILLDDFVCQAPTSSVDECSHVLGKHNCVHDEDVGVHCYDEGEGPTTSENPILATITGFSISGQSLIAGQLIVHDSYGNTGTVCDDGFTNTEAAVVCRSMGFEDGEIVSLSADYYTDYDNQELPILLDDFSCPSAASDISSCSHQPLGTHNCGHSEDVFVQCYDGSGEVDLSTPYPPFTPYPELPTTPVPEEGNNKIVAFYLSEGDHGYVYAVSNNGQTGSVCDDGFENDEASVVCKFLGFSYGSVTDKGHHCTDEDKPILVDDFDCPAGCSSFHECTHSPLGQNNCQHEEDVFIQCHDDDFISRRLKNTEGNKDKEKRKHYEVKSLGENKMQEKNEKINQAKKLKTLGENIMKRMTQKKEKIDKVIKGNVPGTPVSGNGLFNFLGKTGHDQSNKGKMNVAPLPDSFAIYEKKMPEVKNTVGDAKIVNEKTEKMVHSGNVVNKDGQAHSRTGGLFDFTRNRVMNKNRFDSIGHSPFGGMGTQSEGKQRGNSKITAKGNNIGQQNVVKEDKEKTNIAQ